MEYIKSLYKGRINRTSFSVGLIIFFLTTIILEGIKTPAKNGIISLVGSLILVALLIFNYSLYVRRLHDANHSGWLALITLIPVGNIFLLLYLIFKPGDKKKNSYGTVPKTKDRFLKDLFALKN